ncbi:MAG: hypothetical protein K8R53_07290, partial [Bacteroidales bacterium]|nr:hypothetical protein [Bacteroidales bacterium]
MNRITEILLGPYLVSLIIAVVIILLLPPVFDRYKIELFDQGVVNTREEIIYLEDLDGDGKSEWITTKENVKGNATLKIYSHEKVLLEPVNFHGKYPKKKHYLHFGDFNQNGKKEIFVFTQMSDSAFLFFLEPFSEKDTIVHKKFISVINKFEGYADFSITNIFLEDLNNDSIKDLLFGLGAGFSKFPRNIVMFDFANDTLIFSPFTGSVCYISDINDIDDDHEPEIFLGSSATANIYESDTFSFHDRSSWLMILDHKLNFAFTPQEFPGKFSGIVSYCLQAKNKKFILVGFNSRNFTKNPSKILLYSDSLKLIKELELHCTNQIYFPPDDDNGFFYILHENTNTIELVNLDFNTIKTILPRIGVTEMKLLDIDLDGSVEWILCGEDGQTFKIYRNKFQYPVTFKIDDMPFKTGVS